MGVGNLRRSLGEEFQTIDDRSNRGLLAIAGIKFRIVTLPQQQQVRRWTSSRVSPECAMRQSKFLEAQIGGIQRKAEAGVSVAEILLKHFISRPTLYHWKSRYDSA